MTDDRMKIAWLHSHFYNWMGGTKFVLEVVRHLQKHAHVEIVVQNRDPSVIQRFTGAGITVHNLGSPSTNAPRFRGIVVDPFSAKDQKWPRRTYKEAKGRVLFQRRWRNL